MKSGHLAAVVGMVCLMAFESPLFATEENSNPVLRSGDLFPEIPICATEFSREELNYLNLADGSSFSIAEIRADVIVVEFMSSYCMYCSKIAPTIHQAYSASKDDPDLRDRVRWIGVAVGDTRAEADRFAEKNHVPFPVALDTDYQLHDAVGGPRIPFVVVVKRYSLERLVVASFHIGLIHSSAGFLQEMKEILETDAAFMKGK